MREIDNVDKNGGKPKKKRQNQKFSNDLLNFLSVYSIFVDGYAQLLQFVNWDRGASLTIR